MVRGRRLPPIFVAKNILYSTDDSHSIRIRFGYTPSNFPWFKFSTLNNSDEPTFPTKLYSNPIPINSTTKLALLVMVKKGYIPFSNLEYYKSLPAPRLSREEVNKVMRKIAANYGDDDDDDDDDDDTTDYTSTPVEHPVRTHQYNTRRKK